MQNITIWHNPRCSKSREAITLIEHPASIIADFIRS